MTRAALIIAAGLVLLGAIGYLVAPDFSSDLLGNLPFIGGNRGPASLTYWGLWEDRNVMQPLIDEYQRQNPNVTINYEMRDPNNHFQTVRSRIGTDGPPDIIRVHANWVPFLKDNLSAIPTGIIDTETYEQTFYPITQQTLKFDGKYYGIPLMTEGLALVYNQDLLAQEGIAQPPTTWDTFREATRQLTKTNAQNQITQAGAAMGYARNVDYFSDIVGLMFAQNGVSFVDENGAVNFHQSVSPDGRNLAAEALQFYSLFALSERSWDPTWENSTQAFASGKVAMIFIPSHRLHEILSVQPSFTVGVTTVPQLPNVVDEGISWANYWVEVVPQQSSSSNAAWNFLAWLIEQEQLTNFYRTTSEVRAFGEPYPRADMAQNLSTDKYAYPYVQQAPTATTWHFTYGTHDEIANDAVVKALENAIENVAAGNDAQGELSQAAAQAQQALSVL